MSMGSCMRVLWCSALLIPSPAWALSALCGARHVGHKQVAGLCMPVPVEWLRSSGGRHGLAALFILAP